MDRKSLEQLPRAKLQALGKKNGIGANKKSVDIISALLQLGAEEGVSSSSSSSQKKKPVEKKLKNAGPDAKVDGKMDVDESKDGEIVPSYWGSILDPRNPAATFKDTYSNDIRRLTIAMISEPFLMKLFRINAVFFPSQKAVEEVRIAMANFVKKLTSDLVKGGNNELDAPLAEEICRNAVGLEVIGSRCLSVAPLVDHLTGILEQAQAPDTQTFWEMFCTALQMPPPETLFAQSVVIMRTLLDSNRATLEGNGEDVVELLCCKLDMNTLRHVLSYLAAAPMSKKRTKKLFSDDNDLYDNWNNAVCHETVEDALEEGVNVKKETDDHTGAHLLHKMAAEGSAEDCQRIIDMGVDPNITTHKDFENGDGWGELEYSSFTPLMFAAANGAYENAKVLLKNGAKTSMRGGWDGGFHTPFIDGGDYWYTSSNTALHHAARGDHAAIINLILDGPDEESLQYAASKGIDLKETWTTSLYETKKDEKMPTYEFHYESMNVGDASTTLTPLTMAIIFSNLSAVKALLKHGADLDQAVCDVNVKKVLLHGFCKTNSKATKEFTGLLIGNMKKAYEPSLFEKLINFIGGDDDSDEEDEEELWDQDDWDRFQVPAGDKKVVVQEDDDENAAAVDGLHFAKSVLEVVNQVHPGLHMSRNGQYIVNDFVTRLIEGFVADAKAKSGGKGSVELTMEGVLAWAKKFFTAPWAEEPNELYKHSKGEIEKEKEDVYDASLLEYLKAHHPEVDTSKGETGALSRLLGYFSCEIVELAGNTTRDNHLECINAMAIKQAIDNDEELDVTMRHWVFGNALTTCRIIDKYTLKQFESENKKVEDFQLQDWVPARDRTCSLKQVKNEIRYFRGSSTKLPFSLKPEVFGPFVPHSAFKAVVERAVVLGGGSTSVTDHGSLVWQLACESYLLKVVKIAYQTFAKRIASDSEDALLEEMSGEDVKQAVVQVDKGEASKPQEA